jgi:hypothetical protein
MMINNKTIITISNSFHNNYTNKIRVNIFNNKTNSIIMMGTIVLEMIWVQINNKLNK